MVFEPHIYGIAVATSHMQSQSPLATAGKAKPYALSRSYLNSKNSLAKLIDD